MPLHHVVDGGAGERVVLVHGFTQTLAAMEPLATRLRDRHELVRVDLPGHGGSMPPLVGFAEAAALLGEAGGAAAYLGYSLGGRLCLRLALDRPELVRALVLIGASPGLDDPVERAARQASDDALAAELERVGLERFLDRWLAQPLFATLPPERAGRAGRLANTTQGLAAILDRPDEVAALVDAFLAPAAVSWPSRRPDQRPARGRESHSPMARRVQ